MTSKIKDNIKNYLLIDCKKYIIKDFEYMIFNLKNIENINQYQNKMMFIMCNYNNETFELIIKLLSSKTIIYNLNYILISLFSKCYHDNCNMEKYNFLENHEKILKLMVDSFNEYIVDVNIYNLLNFIWFFIRNKNNIETNVNNYVKILFKSVMWKYIIIKINKLISINNIESNNKIINFILYLDFNTFNILQLYFKTHNIVY